MLKTTVTICSNLRNKVCRVCEKLNLKKHENTKGRKLKISLADSITPALFKQNRKIQTKKSLFEMTGLSCCYKTFTESLNRVVKSSAKMISALLAINGNRPRVVKHADSADIPVCLNKNAKNHKTSTGCLCGARRARVGFTA